MSGEVSRLDDYRRRTRVDSMPWADLDNGLEWLTTVIEPTALGTVPLEFARAHPTPWGIVIGGDVATDPPGWWVCPDCGRRRDRAGEPRTVTAVVCTGPDRPYTPRHAPTEMTVQR